jgi:TonB family protein
MNSTLVESRPWSRRRWWGLVALVFVVQLGLIFWLGDTVPIRPRPAAPAFTFKLAGNASAELLALNDPTLFALPHRQGSAGPPSQRTPRPEANSFQWPEPTNSFLLAVGQLGAVFSRFIETNEFNSLQLPANLKPTLTLPDLPPLAISAEQSTLLLEGDLAQWRLITPLSLRSWPNPDILTDSVVRIAVDSEGRPVSPTLLSSSGSVAADQHALELARAARFEPVRRNPADPALKPASDLSLVRMVFRWHTLPPPPTNTPAASP